jgi:hypothetical protein
MKTMAIWVGASVLCATIVASAGPKNIQRNEERCEDYCPSSWERQINCNVG